ncbi:Uncharacterised protein [Citrobacter braakii]|jgi:hypothetical protein|nr:Uncharacterised protein [Citrobacter braakii]
MARRGAIILPHSVFFFELLTPLYLNVGVEEV